MNAFDTLFVVAIPFVAIVTMAVLLRAEQNRHAQTARRVSELRTNLAAALDTMRETKSADGRTIASMQAIILRSEETLIRLSNELNRVNARCAELSATAQHNPRDADGYPYWRALFWDGTSAGPFSRN